MLKLAVGETSLCGNHEDELPGHVPVIHRTARCGPVCRGTGASIREIVVAREILSYEALDAILDPLPLTNPGVPGKRKKS